MLEPLSGAIARRPLAAIFGLGVAFLLALLVLVDTDHVLTTALGGSSNDQVGYISVARNLAESGKLESSLVYPSVLHQKTTSNALYVPGHYYALALSFWLLGYSPLSAFAPSLLGYLVASCALFIAVRRLYDPTTASLATLIFMTFPAHLIYSGMAMAELTLLAACMLCFAVFVYVPRR